MTRTMPWRVGRWAAGVPLALAVLYLAGPLWAGWNLRQAMRNRDTASLEARVDWQTLRQNMKPRLAAALKDDADKSGMIGGLLKRAVGGTISNAAIDTFVTPGNLARILAGRAFVIQRFPGSGQPTPADDDAEDADDPAPPRRIRWAFFESPTRFRVEAVNPKLPNARIVSTLALQGLSWRLVDVDIVKR
jgi:Protein of unknown function (DUF2939)